jgi:hypothetical protein
VKSQAEQQAFDSTNRRGHDSAILCLFGDVPCHHGRQRHYFYEQVLLQLWQACLSVS